jgi:hypothetical protein
MCVSAISRHVYYLACFPEWFISLQSVSLHINFSHTININTNCSVQGRRDGKYIRPPVAKTVHTENNKKFWEELIAYFPIAKI